MKVRDTQAIPPTPNAEPVKPVSTSGTVSDRVTVEKAQELEAAVAAVRSDVGSGRAAKLQEIAAAVKGGTYRPNANRIAEQILQSAELDARLRAMLSR